jgi:hypothetical protein
VELVDFELLHGRWLQAQVCGVANIHRIEICCIGNGGIGEEYMSVSQVIIMPIVMFIEKIGPPLFHSGNRCDFFVCISMVAFEPRPNCAISVSAFILLYCRCV